MPRNMHGLEVSKLMKLKIIPKLLIFVACSIVLSASPAAIAETCDPSGSQASLNACSQLALQNAENKQNDALKQLAKNKSQDSQAKLKIVPKKERFRETRAVFPWRCAATVSFINFFLIPGLGPVPSLYLPPD